MKTLASLVRRGNQILKGTSKRCIDCQVSIDPRSKRCRTCHQRYLTMRRFPLHKRLILQCTDCGTPVSHYSVKHGKGRCRSCYNLYRVRFPSLKRSVDRPLSNSCYTDADGNIRWSFEYFEDGTMTVAAGWACLRRSWKAFKIAKNRADYLKMTEYAKAIRKLQLMLNISRTDFPELMLDADEDSRFSYSNRYGNHIYSAQSDDYHHYPPNSCPSGPDYYR